MVKMGPWLLRRRFLTRAVFVVLLAGLLLLFLPAIRDMFLSGLLILEVMRPLQEGIFSRLTPEPLVMTVAYPGEHRQMEANLYMIPDGKRRGGVILVHGVNEVGKEDPRMVWIARIFARAGFVVLVPDFLGFKSLKLRAEDSSEMVDSFLYLSSRKDLVHPDKIGLIGFSYGAGPTLIAAADPRIRDQVHFVVSFGGYYDLVNLIRFVTTGFYEYGEKQSYMRPSDYDRWIFLKYNLDLLSDAEDKSVLARIAEAKARGEAVDASSLTTHLTPSGKAVYRLLVNRDPDRVKPLIEKLSPAFQRQIEQLSPSRVIDQVKAYVFIVHGEPDPFIPHTESLRLADALKGKGRYHLGVMRIFQHVRPTLPTLNLKNLFTIYLPEAVKLYALTYDLLSQRR